MSKLSFFFFTIIALVCSTCTVNTAVNNGFASSQGSSGCSTSQIAGLSVQLLQTMNELIFEETGESNTFVNLKDAQYSDIWGNVQVSSAVQALPFIHKDLVEPLRCVITTKTDATLSINSIMRTVAQQFILREWSYQACGIGLAGNPGFSSHEAGLAIDINSNSIWRDTFTGCGWEWYGSIDAKHFSAGSDDLKSQRWTLNEISRKSIQRLWNNYVEWYNARNTAQLTSLVEDGLIGAQTKLRLKNAPCDGFQF